MHTQKWLASSLPFSVAHFHMPIIWWVLEVVRPIFLKFLRLAFIPPLCLTKKSMFFNNKKLYRICLLLTTILIRSFRGWEHTALGTTWRFGASEVGFWVWLERNTRMDGWGVRVSIALQLTPQKHSKGNPYRYTTHPITTPWNYKGCFILELPNSHFIVHGTNRLTISSVVWFFLFKRSSDSEFSFGGFFWVSRGVGFHF